jgi:aminoglycoside 6'-N-acetyltransferase
MGVDSMKLRHAKPSELTILRYWDTKPHVIAATGDDDVFDWELELSRNPDWRELLIAEHTGRPIGMIHIIDPAREETHY